MRVLLCVVTLLFTSQDASTFSTGTVSKHALQGRSTTQLWAKNKKKVKCNPCDVVLEDDDSEMDRREAIFSMLGTVLAVTSWRPAAAHADYGKEANIEMPDLWAAFMKNLEEEDTSKYIYQGPDPKILLERMEQAFQALATIPDLVEAKKWSQVNGVLTGPMGTLVTTMDQLMQLTSKEKREVSKKLAATAKADLFDIVQAVEKRKGDKALAAHQKATEDLLEFVKSL